ncbi:MAG: DNA polymerase III subunit beta [Bacteroidales bacterium]
MDFIVSSSNLLHHLQAVSKVISGKSKIAILDNFLFRVESGMLEITGSDLETTLITKLSLESSNADGIIAIDAKKILEIIRELPEQPLTFNIDLDSLKVEIVSATGKYSLMGQPGDDFPQIPVLRAEKTTSIVFPSDTLTKAISSAIFATADDTVRPIFNGIFVEILPSEVNFVATDAHKLVKYTRKDIKTGQEASFIFPKKPAAIVKGILPKEAVDVTLEFDEKNVILSFDNFKMICRLIEGNYPNYNSVIPQENPNKLVVDRLEMFSALKRVSIFSNQASSLVGLNITGNVLKIFAQDIDYSISGEEEIKCQYEGDDMLIGFKSIFLMEILANLNTTEVLIELSDPSRAGLIFPKENEDENEEILMLLMPMMIS